MKKYSVLFVLLSMGILLTCLSGCDRLWTGTVKGVITDDDTELGISNVLITIRSLKHGYEVSVLTNSEGEYVIDNARWGPNRVEVYHPRYENVSKFVDIIKDETVDLDFRIDPLTVYVDPVLTVNVVNGNGDPVNQATLDLYQLNETTYEYYFFLGSRRTDESGFADFFMPRMFENEVIEFQLRVAAFGFQDLTRNFALSWSNPEPSLTIVLEEI
jgi:hypothetical protein